MDILSATKAVLEDSIVYLNQITPEQYTQPLDILSNSSIGQHTRHFIEFYQCLIKQANNSSVNYDLRERDLNIETDSSSARGCLEEIISALQNMPLEQRVQLCSGIDPQGMPSNVKRELLYNLEHTIHHLAIINIAIKVSCPEIQLPANFGVAPSTIRYRNEKRAASLQ